MLNFSAEVDIGVYIKVNNKQFKAGRFTPRSRREGVKGGASFSLLTSSTPQLLNKFIYNFYANFPYLAYYFLFSPIGWNINYNC